MKMLPRKSQGELQDSRVVGAGDPHEIGAAAQTRVREIQVDAIQHVEGLETKGGSPAFAELEALRDARVEIGVAGAFEGVAAERAERAEGIGSKGGGIQPGRDLRGPGTVAGEVRVADENRALPAGAGAGVVDAAA